MADQISLTVRSGLTYTLRPVPMRVFPSCNPELWNRFQGKHVPYCHLTSEAQDRLQTLMCAHHTECLTDGQHHYTFAGGMLAYCFPEKVVA